MKTLRQKPYLFLLGLLLLVTLAAFGQALNSKITSADPKRPHFKVITLATGTAVAGSATDLQFTSATFYGYSAVSDTAAPTANASSAYLGFTDPDGGSGLLEGDPVLTETILPGSYVALAPIGTKYNLADLRFLGATGDKILIVYSQ